MAPTAGEDPGSLSDSHRLQFKNFLAAIRGEEEIRVGLSENRTSVSVILGAYQSARTGLKVSLVQIGEVKDSFVGNGDSYDGRMPIFKQ